MALPELKISTFTCQLKSVKDPVKYRAFTSREEELLMISGEGSDDDKIRAMQDVCDACTYGALDIKALPSFDLEAIFLKLRMKSVGEDVEMSYKCTKKNNDGEACNGKILVKIDLTKVGIVEDKNHTNVVMITKDIGITFKYPSFGLMMDTKEEKGIRSIIPLIENIFDGDNVYDAKDLTKEELLDYVLQFQKEHYEKIMEKFVDSMPVLKHTVKTVCPKCGHKDSITFEGLNDFF